MHSERENGPGLHSPDHSHFTPNAVASLSQPTEATGAAPRVGRPRKVTLTRLSTIPLRPVSWLWNLLIPLDELTLLGGRKGVGKSTIACTLAAKVTAGTLEGRYLGQPRSVMVAATEDSWEKTLAPRLVAAGADPERLYRVDVGDSDGHLSLPSDIDVLAQEVARVDGALLLLDPLMSRLDAKLDTHKDAEVRRALEPMTAFAKRAGISVLGIIHVNKSATTDPLTAIMGSRAFASVARSVLMVVKDPEDEARCLLGHEKSNLGPLQPTLVYRIVEALVTKTDEGDVYTGKVDWLGRSDRSVGEVMRDAARHPAVTSARSPSTADTAEGWLEDCLFEAGGSEDSATIKDEGRRNGHSDHSLRTARKRLGVVTESVGYPRRTVWKLPEAVAEAVTVSPCLRTIPEPPALAWSEADQHYLRVSEKAFA